MLLKAAPTFELEDNKILSRKIRQMRERYFAFPSVSVSAVLQYSIL